MSSPFSTPPSKDQRSKQLRTLHDCLEDKNNAPNSPLTAQFVFSNPSGDSSFQCFTVHNVLTPTECANIIQRTEQVGYEAALVNVGGGQQSFLPDVRQCGRCIIDDVDFAKTLYQRLQSVLPANHALHGITYRGPSRPAKGLNERMRILRYEPGHHYFCPHMDGCYQRPDGSEESYFTVMLYLNQDFQGGGTVIYDDEEEPLATVVPRTGSVLVFEHPILHEGAPVQTGVKYAIRTDLMFSLTEES